MPLFLQLYIELDPMCIFQNQQYQTGLLKTRQNFTALNCFDALQHQVYHTYITELFGLEGTSGGI